MGGPCVGGAKVQARSFLGSLRFRPGPFRHHPSTHVGIVTLDWTVLFDVP